MAGNFTDNQQQSIDVHQQLSQITESISDRTGCLTDLDRKKKRWLVIGIVLHSVLTPTLREYVAESLEQIYQTLKLNSNIDTQLYPHHLPSYLNTFLNYEAINSNHKFGLRQQSRFNYDVKDAVDFSKLFLKTHMAHFSAFDDSCDSSALLEIIIGSCIGSSQACAKKVKDEVRNTWAHCDFTKWDDNKYKTCMTLIKELIESLGLQNQGEIITLLEKWNQNGEKFIDGTSPEFVVLGEIQIQVHALLRCIERIASDTPDQITKLKEELTCAVSDLLKRVQALEKANNETIASAARLKERIDEMENTIPKHMQEKYQIHLDEWEKDEDKFTVTRATEHVTGLMEENNVVVVVGSSGSGKSSLIHHVALKIKNEGYSSIPFVSSPDDIIQYRDMKKNQLFVIDNLCGKNYINETDLQMWKKQSVKIEKLFPSKSGNEEGRLKILASCRLQIYKDAKFKSLEIFTKNVVDLQSKDHCYLGEEKCRMIRKYIKNSLSDLCWQKIIEEIEDCHFFPLLCKMSQHKTVEQLTDLFSSPITCMRKDIRDLIQTQPMEKCALVLCVLFPDGFDELLLRPYTRPNTLKQKLNNVLKKISGTKRERLEQEVQQKVSQIVTNFKINLDIEADRRKLIDTFKRLDGTYVKKIGPSYFISHDKLYEMVAVESCHEVTELYLKYAPATLISEQFRFTSVFPKDENQLLIYLGDNDEKLYLKRCLDDLNKKSYKSFFNNQQLNDEKFRSKIMEYIHHNKKPCNELFHRVDKQGMRDKRNRWYGYYTTTPVIEATKIGFYQLIKYLIDIKCNLNKKDGDGYSPLWYSCSYGYINIAYLLLNHNANYDIDELVMACNKGMTDVVKMMVKRGLVDLSLRNWWGQTPLTAACSKRHSDIVYLLLKHNAKYCIDDLVRICYLGMTDSVKVMVMRGPVHFLQCDRKYRMISLYAACKGGHSEIVNLLLNHNVRYTFNSLVDAYGRGMTFVMFWMGIRGFMDLLLCYRLTEHIPLTAESSSDNYIDDLVRACYHGMTVAVSVIVESGVVDPSLYSSKYKLTPMSAACRNGHSEIASILLNYNVNYYIDDLIMACNHRMTGVVRVMIERGLVNISLCNSWEQTPLTVEYSKRHREIINQLFNHTVKFYIDNLVEACGRGMFDVVRAMVKIVMLEKRLLGRSLCHCVIGQSQLAAASEESHGGIINLLITMLSIVLMIWLWHVNMIQLM